MLKKFLFVYVWIAVWAAGVNARPNLVISDIQIGYEDNKTRIALILSKPVNLYARLVPDSNSVIIESPEDTIWEIPLSLEQPQGGFEKYQLNDITDTPRTLTLSCKPVTTLAGSGLQTLPSGQYQFVVDLLTEDPPPPEPEPEIEEPAEPPAPPSITINNPIVEIWPPAPNSVKSIRVAEQKDSTTWFSVTSAFREYFKFDVMADENKILIYLPKTNWLEIDTRLKSSSLVRTYQVQDADPNFSVICIETYKKAWVIDQFMSPNSDGSNDFVLVIADRPPTAEEQERMKEKQSIEKANARRQEQLIMQEKFKEALLPPNLPASENEESNASGPMPNNATAAEQVANLGSSPEMSTDPNMSIDNLAPSQETAPPQTSSLSSDGNLFDADEVSVGAGPEMTVPTTPLPSPSTSQEPAWVMQAREAAQKEQAESMK